MPIRVVAAAAGSEPSTSSTFALITPAGPALWIQYASTVGRRAVSRRAGSWASPASLGIMAEVTRSLPFVAVRDGSVIDQLDRLDNGTIRLGRRAPSLRVY